MALGYGHYPVRSEMGEASRGRVRKDVADATHFVDHCRGWLAGYSLPQMEWGRVVRLIEWTRTGRGMAAMALLNIASVIALGAYLWEQRSDRLEAEAELAAWMEAPLYAPTKVTVHIGPTMETTRVVEEPLLDGPRILADFPGMWTVRLRRIDRDTMICTMPQTGPRPAPYTTTAPLRYNPTWAEYTGDDGTCFAQMQPGEEYDITTVRAAFTTIDGERHGRFLDPVQSAPFTFPGGE